MRFWSVSRAFIREDVDPPERSGRKRSASGLPPGAVNYITARGAARLQAELAALCAAGDKSERITDLKQVLGSVKIVEPPEDPSTSVSFGARVTLRDPHDKTATHTIVGVDELDFEPDAVSWISPLGKALLASQLGDRITLEDGRTVKIVKIE
jgi:transcription elongation GreA/GreB family factor